MNESATANSIKKLFIAGLIATLCAMSPFFSYGQEKNSDVAKWEVEADTLMSQMNYPGALERYNKIVAKTKLKTDDDIRILYKRAFALYSVTEFEKALADINQYLSKFADPQARLLRLYIYQELGDHESQLKDLDEFIGQNPGNPDLLRWRASVLMDAGKYKEAQKSLRELLSLQANPELKAYLGLAYYYQQQPDSAMIVFDEVIKENPEFVQTYLFAGSLCLEEEAYELALQYINRGLAKDPANTTLVFYKGAALVELRNMEEGCRCLTKAFQAGFDDAGQYLTEYCYAP